MSSNSNHIINLTNYEEFFILYMDGELTTVEMNLVDAFLVEHPELKGEFDLLLSTKLPQEELSFDKSILLSGMMKTESVDEELLMYIDDELKGDDKAHFEKKLAIVPEYHLPYQGFLKTKLDPSDTVTHPNKKELFRHSEKVVFLKPWMRVAAAVFVVALAGWMFYQSSGPAKSGSTTDQPVATSKPATNSGGQKEIKDSERPETPQTPTRSDVAVEKVKNKVVLPSHRQQQPIGPEQQPVISNQQQQPKEEEQLVAHNVVRTPSIITNNSSTDLIDLPHSEIINRQSVTNSSDSRNTNIAAAPQQNVAAKGSVKGFLRRATKLIEKRTGIDPTNDGELLIGALALNLK